MKISLLLLVFVVNSARSSKEVFSVGINERGAQFNESVEIDMEENTVTYKVPAHNDIDQSDVLLDYNSGFSATRMPISRECHIERISKKEPSLKKTSKDLASRKFVASKKVKMLVQTIEKKVVKSAKIPRNHLSRRLSEFCGDYTAYEMKTITVDDVEQFSINRRDIQKRSTSTYNVRLLVQKSFFKNTSPGQYTLITTFTCQKFSTYRPAINRCGSFDDCSFSCKRQNSKCRYTTRCRAPKSSPILHAIVDGRSNDDIEVECEETHERTTIYCCDILCRK